MDRRDKILKHVQKHRPGVEIGPSHNPIAPKKEGFQVHIIDHLSREKLVEKYRTHQVNLDNIEEVDFIWSGEPYAELTQGPGRYDWIIASHVIEHTPDLIGFLNNCGEILSDEGVLSLAVPDLRFCFDHFRPLTGLSRIIDSHFQQHAIHTPGTVAEYYLNIVTKDGRIAWNEFAGGRYTLGYSREDALQILEKVRDERVYVDVHSWCFVPHSFRLIVHDLHSLGLIPFREVEFFPTEGCEFFIALSRNGRGSGLSRMQMLEQIDSELKQNGHRSPTRQLMTRGKRLAHRLLQRARKAA